MRSMLLAVFAAALAGAAFVPAVRAQEKKGPGPEQAGRMRDPGKHWEKMGLSKEQSEKLKAAHKAQQEAVKPLQRELRDAMQKLGDQVEDKADEKALQASLDNIDRIQKALEAQHEKFQAELASFLPASARAKMMLHMHKGMMMGGMKGGPGMRGKGHPGGEGEHGAMPGREGGKEGMEAGQ
ncbi:MAG: periplasmic heavy metal sensor [Elusimicrobiota bacterium]